MLETVRARPAPGLTAAPPAPLERSIGRAAVRTEPVAAPVAPTVGRDLTRIPLLSQPPRTPLPAPPTPQPKEQPLGELRDKLTGAPQPIYASFVTPGLWWLNGATPTLAQFYPTSVSLGLTQLGKGDFSLKVSAGADKVGLDGGGSAVTGTDLTSVTVSTKGPSKKANDVTIDISHRPPGAKNATTQQLVLEVRAPHHLKLLGTDHSPKGTRGFLSLTSLQVFDNFAKPMPYIDVNEDFGKGVLEPGVSDEWRQAFDARNKGSDVTRGNAVFQDQYAAELSGGAAPPGMTPALTAPQTPLGSTRAGAFSHDWYVGSRTTGKGVHVSHHVGVFFADHGEYTQFSSPPAPFGPPSPTKSAKPPAQKKTP
jgi:hypothetical protein